MVERIDLSKPRYDQSTYIGRLRHFAALTSPLTLFATDKQLNAAKTLITDYQSGKILNVDTEKLWNAKLLIDSTFHPDTGEKVFLPFRMSSFMPTNLLVLAGMLAPNPTIASIVFWQWTNQSVNVAFNYFNANKSTKMTPSETVVAYTSACGSSVAVAVGLSEALKRAKNLSSGARSILSKTVPFTAVAVAGVANVFLMRRKELIEGIDVRDKEGNVLGKSKEAGKHAITQVAISRVATSFPLLIFPPFIMSQLQKSNFLKSNPRLVGPLNLFTISCCLLGALPAAIAIFPGTAQLPVENVESQFKNFKLKDGSKVETVYFNRDRNIDDEIKAQQMEREGKAKLNAISFDQQIYSVNDKKNSELYNMEIDDNFDDDDEEQPSTFNKKPGLSSYTAPKNLFNEMNAEGNDDIDPFANTKKSKKIADSMNEYQLRGRANRSQLSPERVDAFGKSSENARSYGEVLKEAELDREEHRVKKKIEENRREAKKEIEVVDNEGAAAKTKAIVAERKKRWDEKPTEEDEVKKSEWDEETTTEKRSKWDETPVAAKTKTSRWDATPTSKNYQFGATPVGNIGLQTPLPGDVPVPMTPQQSKEMRYEREMDIRNRYLSDEDLDAVLPAQGYKILEPPPTYQPIRTPARKLSATPTPIPGQMGAGFVMQEDTIYSTSQSGDLIPEIPGMTGTLSFFKEEDMKHFGKLMDKKKEEDMSVEELKERKIMRLLLKIKNGEPPARKTALRQITEKAREFGAAALFNQILPLFISETLEHQERHLLVKVIDRILYKLDDLVRPYVHKILHVIEPMLIDEDYYARVEAREIISNLSKAAGLATMIATMRPDIDNVDEFVRNTTARAFAVVASSLGIPALLPFLKAVCKSKKSWQARHTGIKIIQQIAILIGCAVLPHLKSLVDAVKDGLKDEQQKVKTMTALAISALAEAASPYGVESFDEALIPLWDGIQKQRGKSLASFLKAVGFIIPLMSSDHASHFTKNIMGVLIREFASPDEEMKKIVLKVVKQCVSTEGVEASYIKKEMLPHFFKQFWVRWMALDRRNSKQLVETTVEIAQKVGVMEIVQRIVTELKNESEPYRKMVMEVITKVIETLGSADITPRMEEILVDGILFAFQEQTVEDVIMLNGFGTIVTSLGVRVRPYLQQIASTILWRLNNKSAKVRQQAADLISKIAGVMQLCGEEKLIGTLGQVLYEYLGEEYPEVLGSIIGGLKAICNVCGMSSMTPPIKDLLPRLTPILKNRHEKVQENVIELVGKIADRGADFVSAREWMRICFELLDMLKAHKKSIRRATVLTFGYIAKAIGPQDVLATLLNNLKVQERQNRVCTTVAIAIVAETCSPFTVLPALMNEYRVPELNVQNGVLKSLSFLFEYIGEMGKDYIYAVTPLLEDALIDRDLVHRQTACSAVKHIALGCFGLNCEDALIHLLNYVWPNIFETSPHVINSVIEAVDALRVALGPGVLLQYVVQGLFHPARRVREVYWKIYNNMYIGSQDKMISFYPRLENDERNMYQRCELDLVV
ncbi:Splicing factor 3B subunit 1 [Lobulomyces angularis]|nr:Splicing factor 3B subunit 1 [Lobulomyces angularis]